MSTVLPRYSFYVWLFGLLRLNRLHLSFAMMIAVSMLLAVSLVSLVRGEDGGPVLMAAQVEAARTSPLQTLAAPTAIARCAAALAEAQRLLETANTMQAVMEKRERVRGRLEPTQLIELKVRRAPRSVYMRWRSPDEGQEVIWQENANGNRILVHPGGWRGRLMPMVKVDPKSPRVVEQSRRPIESAGIWALTRQLRELVAIAEKSPAAIRVEMAEGVSFGGGSCTRFRLIRTAAGSADFHSVVFYIDSAAKVPVGFERYIGGAGGRGEPALDEYYAYRELRLNAPLANRDFDAANPAYHFSDTVEGGGDAESIGSTSPTIK